MVEIEGHFSYEFESYAQVTSMRLRTGEGGPCPWSRSLALKVQGRPKHISKLTEKFVNKNLLECTGIFSRSFRVKIVENFIYAKIQIYCTILSKRNISTQMGRRFFPKILNAWKKNSRPERHTKRSLEDNFYKNLAGFEKN
jgi:hypothetical protein